MEGVDYAAPFLILAGRGLIGSGRLGFFDRSVLNFRHDACHRLSTGLCPFLPTKIMIEPLLQASESPRMLL